MERITLPIAGTLAEEAVKIIDKQRSLNEKARLKAAKDSQEFKQLKNIQAQKEKLDYQYELLFEKFEKKFTGITINGYGSGLKPHAIYKSKPQVKSIKNKIIIANQIKGIAPNKVIDFVVKEYLAE